MPGPEQQLGVREHRDDLFPARRLERMPRLVAAPRPRAGAEARAVRHQLPDGDLRDVAERIVNLPQLRHVLDRRIVERQQPAIAQLHDRDAGQRLRDRRPVVDRLFVHRPLRREILVAVEGLRGHGPVLHEHQAAADDARLLDALSIQRHDPCRGIASGGRLCEEQSPRLTRRRRSEA